MVALNDEPDIKERVRRAINWQPIERLPIKHEARDEVNRALMVTFGLEDKLPLYGRLGDDFRRVRPVDFGPTLQKFPDVSGEDPRGEVWHKVVAKNCISIYNETFLLPYRDRQSVDELKGWRFPPTKFRQIRPKKTFLACIGPFVSVQSNL